MSRNILAIVVWPVLKRITDNFPLKSRQSSLFSYKLHVNFIIREKGKGNNFGWKINFVFLILFLRPIFFWNFFFFWDFALVMFILLEIPLYSGSCFSIKSVVYIDIAACLDGLKNKDLRNLLCHNAISRITKTKCLGSEFY